MQHCDWSSDVCSSDLGLNTGLQVSLIAHTFPDFHELVNKALILEDKRTELEDNRKRRMAQQGSHQSQQKARTVPQQNNRFPPQNSFRMPAPTSAPRPATQNFRNPAPANPNPGSNQQNIPRVCYSCRQPGHLTNNCPQKEAPSCSGVFRPGVP